MAACPQAENGHVDIAHTIMEALARIRISGEEWQVLLVILRKTYGWKKKVDEISLSQFCLMTGLKRPHVIRALKKLERKRIIASTKKGTTYANKYMFIKDFDTWVPLPKKIQGSTIIGNLLVPKKVHTKENTKENREPKKFPADSIEVKLATLLKDLLTAKSADFRLAGNINTWAKHIDLMIRRDKLSPETIERAMRWAVNTKYHINKVASAEKMRQRWGEIVLAMNGDKKNNAGKENKFDFV